jgi:ankyrin repeat protein
MVKTIFPFIYILFLFILPAGAVYSQQRAEASGKEPPSQALFLYLNRGDGEPNEVKKLIEQGADVNYSDDQYRITTLHNVCHYGHFDATKMLLNHGA